LNDLFCSMKIIFGVLVFIFSFCLYFFSYNNEEEKIVAVSVTKKKRRCPLCGAFLNDEEGVFGYIVDSNKFVLTGCKKCSPLKIEK